jgi:hypothetical protein
MRLLILFLLINNISYAAKLGNRYFIANKLENVFGPSAKAYVVESILKNGDTFSGPCDPYKFYKDEKNSYNFSENCFSGLHESKLQYWAKESPVRIVLMKKVCSEISKDPRTLVYLNSKRGQVSISEYIVTSLTPFLDNKRKKNILKKLENTTKPQKVIYRLCKSPYWQYI